jgi:SAM-dependent methyltransferase
MSDHDPVSSEAAGYWDDNREKAKDPAFWMAHPLCRQAINRRVSGSPHEWPLDWWKRVHVAQPFRRGLSWGSGLGAFERAAIRQGLVRQIDAFDISPRSLEDSRRQAEAEGLNGIHYRPGDFNDPRLKARTYDVVFFHASLHHVSALERLFRRLSFALKPGGAIYLDEYVGPSRDEWRQSHLGLAQAMLDLVPRAAKLQDRIPLPIEEKDPSEAIRSSEIPRFVREFFRVVAWREYGGQVVDLVMPCVRLDWSLSPEGNRYVEAMLAIEDHELRTNPGSNHHLVAFGRLKPAWALAKPLGRQVARALRSRLGRQTTA